MQPSRTTQEIRGILSDMHTSSSHPDTLKTPEKNTPLPRKIMHLAHSTLDTVGARVSRSHERRDVSWTDRDIPAIGYGGEKIVYLSQEESGQKTVTSVYHFDSLRKSSEQLLIEKMHSYETYQEYFGPLVVPTEFKLVENPWGDGEKVAAIQRFLENTERFSDLTPTDIHTRTNDDEVFAKNIQRLYEGYSSMAENELCPDFADSNLLVSGSSVLIFDTGRIFSQKDLPRLRKQHGNYGRFTD